MCSFGHLLLCSFTDAHSQPACNYSPPSVAPNSSESTVRMLLGHAQHDAGTWWVARTCCQQHRAPDHLMAVTCLEGPIGSRNLGAGAGCASFALQCSLELSAFSRTLQHSTFTATFAGYPLFIYTFKNLLLLMFHSRGRNLYPIVSNYIPGMSRTQCVMEFKCLNSNIVLNLYVLLQPN